MEPRPSFEHVRKTSAQGYRELAWVILLLPAFVVLDWFVFPRLWASADYFALDMLTIIETTLFVVLAYLSLLNLTASGTFSCRIDEERLTCTCPVPGTGDTFSVLLKDITTIELAEESIGDHRHRYWYVWDRSGRRYWLTTNYGNPVDLFIDVVRDIVPNVREIQTQGRGPHREEVG